MMRCYIFDIDGTLADCQHRIHHVRNKDWRAFFAACGDDSPIPHVIELVKDIASAGKAVVYVSGRSDECRRETLAWLGVNGLPGGALFMRKAGDHRPDNLVKAELLDQLLELGFEPIMVFDDRNQVVKMWRERGVPCAQVAEGDF